LPSSQCPAGPAEPVRRQWATGSPAKNPCGIDVRFDSSSGGIAAQQLMNLFNVVTLSNKHPGCAIEHSQFGEAGQPGHPRERRKINVELNYSSMTVHVCPSLLRSIHDQRCLVNGDAPKCVAQVGGEICEGARSAGEEDYSAFPIDPRDQREGKTQRGADRSVVSVGERG